MSNVEHKTTEKEMKEIWERLTAGEASIELAHERIDSFEKVADSMHEIAISVYRVVDEVKNLREESNKINDKIRDIREKPVKRYETVVTAFLTALCGGLVGYFINFLN